MCVRVCMNISSPLTQTYHQCHMGDVGERKQARNGCQGESSERNGESRGRNSVLISLHEWVLNALLCLLSFEFCAVA